MAGHSKFANIKHRKAAQDKKRAGAFTKLIREVTVSVKTGGPDPDGNARLRAAMQAARKGNVPKDRIEAAIKKASDPGDGEDYEEMRYEGYGPAGVAVIVDSLTDNRNRTASEIRATFSKAGGNMGETGSVAFMFDRVGLIRYDAAIASAEEMFEAALEAGAANCESDDEMHEITCDPDGFSAVRDALAEKFGDPDAGRLSWKPNNTTPLDVEQAEKVLNFIDALEDLDDVQYVTANYDIADDVAEKLAG